MKLTLKELKQIVRETVEKTLLENYDQDSINVYNNFKKAMTQKDPNGYQNFVQNIRNQIDKRILFTLVKNQITNQRRTYNDSYIAAGIQSGFIEMLPDDTDLINQIIDDILPPPSKS